MPNLTVAIPTYQREGVLVDTLRMLLAQSGVDFEVLVVDQTLRHEPATDLALRDMEANGQLRWLRLAQPSITRAMNQALMQARGEVVLFLDDDIRPEPGLIAAHAAAQAAFPDGLVAGRVIQPWEENGITESAGVFQFASEQPAVIGEFMGGNFSIGRSLALRLGGFDENFVRVAYRFEAEFAHRYRKEGRRIHFEPRACLHHLKAVAGGTRSYGEHLTTWRPDHAVGAYYYALRTGSAREFLARPLRSVGTRFHLRRPWRVPATLLAELGGMAWAIRLHARGPKYVAPAAAKEAA